MRVLLLVCLLACLALLFGVCSSSSVVVRRWSVVGPSLGLLSASKRARVHTSITPALLPGQLYFIVLVLYQRRVQPRRGGIHTSITPVLLPGELHFIVLVLFLSTQATASTWWCAWMGAR